MRDAWRGPDQDILGPKDLVAPSRSKWLRFGEKTVPGEAVLRNSCDDKCWRHVVLYRADPRRDSTSQDLGIPIKSHPSRSTTATGEYQGFDRSRRYAERRKAECSLHCHWRHQYSVSGWMKISRREPHTAAVAVSRIHRVINSTMVSSPQTPSPAFEDYRGCLRILPHRLAGGPKKNVPRGVLSTVIRNSFSRKIATIDIPRPVTDAPSEVAVYLTKGSKLASSLSGKPCRCRKHDGDGLGSRRTRGLFSRPAA